MPDPEPRKREPPPYPAEKARQGEIILRSLTRRLIFIGGLIALALFILLVRFWPL
ncbi:hypothetical protein ACFW16_25410 [Inquilinus sp. NPDC058860]|uniref:hypothetical protein n=1 Tax=Inquilinus sp. NPDC058860 TaxID=3346652 RepID=UPI00367465DE